LNPKTFISRDNTDRQFLLKENQFGIEEPVSTPGDVFVDAEVADDGDAKDDETIPANRVEHGKLG